MDIRGTDTPLLDWSGDAIALGLFEEETSLTGELSQLDEKAGGTLAELIEETEFEGKSGSSAVTRIGGGSAIRKLILIGLGKQDELSLDNLRLGAAAVARRGKKEKVKSLGISFPVVENEATSTAAIAEGMILSLHQDNRFKSEPEDKPLKLETVDILGVGAQSEAVEQAQTITSAVILARELVAAPANSVNPVTFAETAQTLATDYGLDIEILEQDECEKLGMGAFLGVAKASDLPPKFIHLILNGNWPSSGKV